MTGVFCVFEARRIRREERGSGKSRYLPALPEAIELGVEVFDTGYACWPVNRHGWRRFAFLGGAGMLRELGKIGSTSEYLFLAVLPEDRANVLRNFECGVEVSTLGEHLAGFSSLPAAVRKAWPREWLRRDANGEPDESRPFVGSAPAAARALIRAGNGSSSSAEDAERTVRSSGRAE